MLRVLLWATLGAVCAEIDRFVPRAEMDERYLDSPYYLVPDDRVGQEAFAVIRDAMAAKRLVGLGRIVLSNRERPILIEPMGSGLRGITLRYAHEVRDQAEYFADIFNRATTGFPRSCQRCNCSASSREIAAWGIFGAVFV